MYHTNDIFTAPLVYLHIGRQIGVDWAYDELSDLGAQSLGPEIQHLHTGLDLLLPREKDKNVPGQRLGDVDLQDGHYHGIQIFGMHVCVCMYVNKMNEIYQ